MFRDPQGPRRHQSGHRASSTAQMDSVPIVVITAIEPAASIGTRAFQETDIFGIHSADREKHSWVVPAIQPRSVGICC